MQPALKEASPIRLPLDSIKKEDLKAVFEILMIEAEMRTI